MGIDASELCVFHWIIRNAECVCQISEIHHVTSMVVPPPIQKLLQDIDADHDDVVFYSEFRWHSRDEILKLF
jgi:hypothetical protein